MRAGALTPGLPGVLCGHGPCALLHLRPSASAPSAPVLLRPSAPVTLHTPACPGAGSPQPHNSGCYNTTSQNMAASLRRHYLFLTVTVCVDSPGGRLGPAWPVHILGHCKWNRCLVSKAKAQKTQAALLLAPHWPECSHMAAPVQGMLGNVVFGLCQHGLTCSFHYYGKGKWVLCPALTFSALLIYHID